MSVISWDNDDSGYFSWLDAHPTAFAANILATGTRQFTVHRAACRAFAPINADSVNPYTGRDYRKITAYTLEELVSWGASQGYVEFRYGCHCKPTEATPSAVTDKVELDRLTDSVLDSGMVSRPLGNDTPTRSITETWVFARCARVRAWARTRARGNCELCEAAAPFVDREGRPFLEIHHILPMSDLGPDTVENVGAVCPNCHRKLHHSAAKIALTAALRVNVLRHEAVISGENELSTKRVLGRKKSA
jgi:hypothetical protein